MTEIHRPPGRGRIHLESGHGYVAGLESFNTPDLETVDARRRQIWALTLLVLVIVSLALAFLTALKSIIVPSWITPETAQLSLLLLIALFCLYAALKEQELNRIAKKLIREKIVTASLTSRVDQITALLDAAKVINVDLDLEEVLAAVLRSTLEVLDADSASIMLTRGDDELRTVATAGASAAAGARLHFGEGIAGQVAASREPVLVQGNVPGRYGKPFPHLESSMSVPLIHRGLLLGVLNVNAKSDKTFSEHDLRALSLFGEHAAGAIANAQMFEAQRLLSAQRSYQAFHDPLTNLPNRALLLEHVSHELIRRRDDTDRIAVLFLDIDNFKEVNDRLGHAAGDELLRGVARCLRESIREGDTVARFGGDEFAILATGLRSIDDATNAAGRVVESLRKPFTVLGQEITVHASIGIAFEEPGIVTAQELLHRGDLAMQAVKRKTKNDVRIFEPSMKGPRTGSIDVEADLPDAIKRGEIQALFQPVVMLESGKPVAIEALARWEHTRYGPLTASAFLPHVDGSPICETVDLWMLNTIAGVVHQLLVQGLQPMWIGVNLSPASLDDPELSTKIETIAKRHEIKPSTLGFEISAPALAHNLDTALSQLQALNASGARILLDGFGTGAASFAKLHTLPINAIKIDRTFIESLETDLGAETVVDAIIKTGALMVFDVIGVGIERQTQVERLTSLGCHFGQGNLFSPPLNADQLIAYLARSNGEHH